MEPLWETGAIHQLQYLTSAPDREVTTSHSREPKNTQFGLIYWKSLEETMVLSSFMWGPLGPDPIPRNSQGDVSYVVRHFRQLQPHHRIQDLRFTMIHHQIHLFPQKSHPGPMISVVHLGANGMSPPTSNTNRSVPPYSSISPEFQ